MTRLALCSSLGTLTLIVGLVTGIVQSHNRAVGLRLAEIREETTLIEAVNGASAARILRLDHGPLDLEQLEADKLIEPKRRLSQ